MNWEAISAIGELLGSFCVLITLIYLALQIRQNTTAIESNKRFAQAQIYQARADAVMKIHGEHAIPEIFARLVNEDQTGLDWDKISSLSMSERLKLRQYAAILDTHADNIEVQRELGLMTVDNATLAQNDDSFLLLYEISTRLGMQLRPTTRRAMAAAGFELPAPD